MKTKFILILLAACGLSGCFSKSEKPDSELVVANPEPVWSEEKGVAPKESGPPDSVIQKALKDLKDDGWELVSFKRGWAGYWNNDVKDAILYPVRYRVCHKIGGEKERLDYAFWRDEFGEWCVGNHIPSSASKGGRLVEEE